MTKKKTQIKTKINHAFHAKSLVTVETKYVLGVESRSMVKKGGEFNMGALNL